MPTALLIALSLPTLACLAFLVRQLRGEPRGRAAILVALRLLALCAIITAWLGPTRERWRTVALPARAIIALDTSQSMSLPAGRERQTRLDVARAAAGAVARALGAATYLPRIAWASLADRLAPLPDLRRAASTGPSTDLRRAVADLADDGPASSVLISDGADTEGVRASDLTGAARAAGLRLSTIAVGDESAVKDIAVSAVNAPRRVRANSDFELTAAVRFSGFAGQKLQAEVRRDNQPLRTLPVPAGSAILKTTLRSGAPGRYRYTVRIAPQPGEVSAANNSGSVLVEVVPDKPEVLVIAGAPSMEYAFLKRALLGDKDLRPRLVVRKAAQGFWRDDAAPAKITLDALADLRRTKAVLLQNLPLTGLGDLPARVASFVRDGGGLAVLGGPDAFSGAAGSALGGLLPVDPGAAAYVDELARPQPAPAGDTLARALQSGDIPLSSLPPIRGRNALAAARPGAAAALTASGAPLLASWQVGRGRVLVLATDGIHHWAFRAGATARDQRAVDAFWSTLADWLTEVRDDRPVIATFERETYALGAPAGLLVQVSDASSQPVAGAAVTADLRLASSPAQQVVCPAIPGQPGRYEAVVATESLGSLQATVTAALQGHRLGSAQAETAIIPSLAELAEGKTDFPLLRRLAEGTGGAFAASGQAASLAQRFSVPPETLRRPVRQSPARGAWMLLAVLVLWAVDWSLRRRWYR